MTQLNIVVQNLGKISVKSYQNIKQAGAELCQAQSLESLLLPNTSYCLASTGC